MRSYFIIDLKIIIYSIFLLSILHSCSTDKKSYFKTIAKNDLPLQMPKRGEWRYNHNETPQTLEDFVNAKPLTPNQQQKIIYLKPIGNFSPLQLKQIEYTRSYMALFFQLKTVILDKVGNVVIPKNARRIGPENHEQLFAPYVRDSVVMLNKPAGGIVIMGITEMDLYPDKKWNFVFGLASYQKGVAVSSTFRLQHGPLSERNYRLSSTRLLKVSAHEIGHMFGLSHCLYAQCLMNGTNSMKETDKSILRLCSHCQRKLNSTLKYNNENRLAQLIAFSRENKMITELSMLNADLNE
ncbi:matrixin family metalloprotease [Pedobacter frigidisoli]|uniref:Matrixin family metalloprotease n=1 Tax=Pedobacter frigidisoli TaxID=2530455 RepID=A0A4R0P4P6_9SPHI|nr:archaemetzincin [Pedobacter frigidisoli]TCD10749.1 matrixin family metalloprotease [Pedobacter frigidisoli]